MRSDAEEDVAKSCKWRKIEENVEKPMAMEEKMNWQAWKNQGNLRTALGK